MKKIRIVLMAVAVLISGTASFAQAAIEVTGGAYAGIYDKYLWRGYNLSNSQPVLQGGVDVSAEGFTLSYWTNVQLSDGDLSLGRDSDEATETDITLNYSASIKDLLTINAGNIYYTFNVPGSTHELYLGVVGNTLFCPSFKVYYDWDLANDLDMDGLFYTASVGHTFSIAEKHGLNLAAAVNYNQESPYVGDYTDWHNYELSASADIALTEQLKIKPQFLYSSGISDEAKDAIDSEMVSGLSVILTF